MVTVKADGLTMHVLHYPVDMRYSVLIFQVQSTQGTSPKGRGKRGVDCLSIPSIETEITLTGLRWKLGGQACLCEFRTLVDSVSGRPSWRLEGLPFHWFC